MRRNEREFHVNEYNSVRAEISTLLARIENLFKYSVIASATVFAWLMSNTFGTTEAGNLCIRAPAQILTYAWGIPTGFTYFAASLAVVNYFRVQHLGKYLLQLEKVLGTSSLGWQKFDGKDPPWLTISTIAVWALMLAASTVAGHLGREAIQGTQRVKASEAKVSSAGSTPNTAIHTALAAGGGQLCPKDK